MTTGLLRPSIMLLTHTHHTILHTSPSTTLLNLQLRTARSNQLIVTCTSKAAKLASYETYYDITLCVHIKL